MIRSMFTAISSLNAHQAWMDVTGNNLTNVNTPGYKSQKVSFQDQISQILRSGAAPAGNLGGLNRRRQVADNRLEPDVNALALPTLQRDGDAPIQVARDRARFQTFRLDFAQ